MPPHFSTAPAARLPHPASAASVLSAFNDKAMRPGQQEVVFGVRIGNGALELQAGKGKPACRVQLPSLACWGSTQMGQGTVQNAVLRGPGDGATQARQLHGRPPSDEWGGTFLLRAGLPFESPELALREAAPRMQAALGAVFGREGRLLSGLLRWTEYTAILRVREYAPGKRVAVCPCLAAPTCLC